MDFPLRINTVININLAVNQRLAASNVKADMMCSSANTI